MIIAHSWIIRRWSRSKPYKSQKTPAPVESHLAGCGVREALCSDATRSQLTDAEQAACTTSGGSGWCCWNFLVDSLRSASWQWGCDFFSWFYMVLKCVFCFLRIKAQPYQRIRLCPFELGMTIENNKHPLKTTTTTTTTTLTL